MTGGEPFYYVQIVTNLSFVLFSVLLDNSSFGYFFFTNFSCEWDEYHVNSDALKQFVLLLQRFHFFYKNLI